MPHNSKDERFELCATCGHRAFDHMSTVLNTRTECSACPRGNYCNLFVPLTTQVKFKMRHLDPSMITFLLDHPMARSVVYGMMRNAATTNDDPKMIEWYHSVKAAKTKEERSAAWAELMKHETGL